MLLLNECLLFLLFISLSNQSGNFWIHPGTVNRMHPYAKDCVLKRLNWKLQFGGVESTWRLGYKEFLKRLLHGFDAS
jgi:hypothetical protein